MRGRLWHCRETRANLAGSASGSELEPTSLAEIFDDIRRVADAVEVRGRAEKLIGNLSERVENVRKRAARITHRPRCFLMEWVDPLFLFRSLGTGIGRYRGWSRSVRPKASAVGADRLASSVECTSEFIVLALCGYDIAPRTLRLRIAQAISCF